MAVESNDRWFRWAGAVGDAHQDGRPMRPDTTYFLASIDKLFNATIVLKLSESGQVDLDSSASTYLPRKIMHGLHRLNGVDHSEQITVRHLLGHTSGLPDWLEDRPKRGRSLTERLLPDGDMEIGLDGFASIVRDLKPHFPPQDFSTNRQRVRYSDTNYMLLIALIEAVTGQSLHEVHEELLFRPLDLRHTYHPGLSEPYAPTPKPAVLRFKGQPLRIPLFMQSIRAVYSTADDTLAFLHGLVRGDIFGDPLTGEAMQHRWRRFGLPLDRVALRSPGWPIEYGLGIMRFRLPRIFNSLRAMPPVVGHTGSTGCWLFYSPQLDMLLTGSVDEVTAGAVPYMIVPKILSILGQHTPIRSD